MKLGFVGAGALTAAMVTGLKTFGKEPLSIVVSPRNAEIAAGLASLFPDVSIAADNQAVLDESDIVVLAVRPQIAEEVLSELRFRTDHHVVSVIAILSLERINELTAPAGRVTKALPLPTIAYGQGATLVYPPDPDIVALFGQAARVIEVRDADEYNSLSVVTATFASYFQYLDTIHRWLKDHGVEDAKGRDYILSIYKALSGAPEMRPDVSLTHLASDEYATRGGLNEQVLRELMTGGVFDMFAESLGGIHRRITGAASS
ncbi:MAG TPA: pyrroline-5-carboxylate reductase [Rhizobiaceae bacterium]|nr:pyrroline-5-carboxylate reductase [Rhizobiaceae bacterium]